MSRAPAVRLSGSAQLGAQKLFDGLSFEALPNAWTCLLGPSGVGKSTLLRLIAGLETGAVFDGAVTSSDGQALTGRCAWMAQDDLLLPWLTVAQNIDLGAKLRGAAPDPAARDALIDRFGLAAQRESRPAQLSGGQRQRVALARTLMEDRPVVLLDEPFSALDAKTRAEMQEAAFAALAGRTVILVTHDPAEAARLGQRIYLMHAGGLSDIAPPVTPPIRPVEDHDTLTMAAALLQRMRAMP